MQESSVPQDYLNNNNSDSLNLTNCFLTENITLPSEIQNSHQPIQESRIPSTKNTNTIPLAINPDPELQITSTNKTLATNSHHYKPADDFSRFDPIGLVSALINGNIRSSSLNTRNIHNPDKCNSNTINTPSSLNL